MSLSVSRVSVGDTGTDAELRQVLADLGAPAGENWTGSITAATPKAAWEVVMEGAPRNKGEHVDWEILQHDGKARFRKLFLGKDEKTVEAFKRAARKLVWECVQFRENPVRAVNPPLGEAFEETVWGLLRHEDMTPVHVRFGVWREGPDGMKYVCKVEYSSARKVPWSWWSGLVRTPADLAAELSRALLQRRKRQYVCPSALAALRRRPARRPRTTPSPAAAAAANRAAAEERAAL